jgi:hypothetical protein
MSHLDANSPPLRHEAHGPGATQFMTLTIVSIVLVAIALVWSLVDARQVGNAAVWMKPLKFALSFVVLFGTIALVEQRLSATVRSGWQLRVTGWVMAAAFLSEMAYMTHQAALAQPSHYNIGTEFHLFMYQVVMAGGAVSLVLGVALIGWIAQRDPKADLGDGLRAGIFVGFNMTFVLTLITAGYLSANGGHFVGEHAVGAPVMPLFGWSGVTGDLRPAHFAALHSMQVLPLLGLWLDHKGSQTPARTVGLAGILYSCLTFALFVQALMGLPLISMG